MARARNIKPSFFANDQLGELPPLARLLFIGLWGLADRKGKLEDRPKRIKAEVLPYDDCDVDEYLNLLQPEFIARYTVNGIACIQILTFLKHQKPHPKETEFNLPYMPENNQAVNRCELAGNKSGKYEPKNLKDCTSNLKVSTSPVESLLLNVESPILNVDCCSPRTEGAEENDNNIDGKIKINVNESEESVTKPHEDGTMATGTRSVAWAEKNWGRMISPGESESIIAWADEFSIRGSTEPDAVIIEALKRCLDADARNMNYLRAVLTDWRDHKVLTVANVEAREVERKSQKEHNRNKDPVNMPKNLVPKKDPHRYDNFYL